MIDDIKPYYPQDFNDQQKEDYDLLIREAKVLFPDAPLWSIKLGVEAYVRLGNNERPEISKEKIEEFRKRHDNETMVYETPTDLNLEYIPAPVEFLYTSNIDNKDENIQTNNEESSIS